MGTSLASNTPVHLAGNEYLSRLQNPSSLGCERVPSLASNTPVHLAVNENLSGLQYPSLLDCE